MITIAITFSLIISQQLKPLDLATTSTTFENKSLNGILTLLSVLQKVESGGKREEFETSCSVLKHK
jgi:hypothetical protein